MKKIIASTIALLLVLGALGTGAYALWITNVTANNITINAGNIGLKISTTGAGGSYASTADFAADTTFSNIMPNYNTTCASTIPVYLHNSSTANITMAITAQLTNMDNASWFSTNWATMSDTTYARFGDSAWTNQSGDVKVSAWYAAPTVTNVTLAQNEYKTMYMCLSTDLNFPQALASTTTQSTWVLTGTQL